ncbi:hypothetical protein E3H11_04630 [Bradyrhizobium brasilense]|uniref:hypothetical protein n=1 Tax=Bradyrhizobium brasilense TaxID=1419277 RepID=UPI001456D033|nr:hypothetical protein [Bradyrhizobium brasilense]NLS68214.1 hypothetical protein [Bradyrhizobium brasilense]
MNATMVNSREVFSEARRNAADRIEIQMRRGGLLSWSVCVRCLTSPDDHGLEFVERDFLIPQMAATKDAHRKVPINAMDHRSLVVARYRRTKRERRK